MQYVTPVKGVRDELVKMGGDAAALADSPILFPSAEDAARLKTFADLPDEVDAAVLRPLPRDHRGLTVAAADTGADRSLRGGGRSRTSC